MDNWCHYRYKRSIKVLISIKMIKHLLQDLLRTYNPFIFVPSFEEDGVKKEG